MTRLAGVSSSPITKIALSQMNTDISALAAKQRKPLENRTDSCGRSMINAGVAMTALSIASSLAGLVSLGGILLCGALGCCTVGLATLCLGSEPQTPEADAGPNLNKAALAKKEEASTLPEDAALRLKLEDLHKKSFALEKMRVDLDVQMSKLVPTPKMNPVELAEQNANLHRLILKSKDLRLAQIRCQEERNKIAITKEKMHESYPGALLVAEHELARTHLQIKELEIDIQLAAEALKKAEDDLLAEQKTVAISSEGR